ncbi:MAG: hypothetical protein HUN04_18340 [Desulfobacter sp.]|nr:MAG: hypothetical protein HUN04_18340 [Desulfobacter sp.]
MSRIFEKGNADFERLRKRPITARCLWVENPPLKPAGGGGPIGRRDSSAVLDCCFSWGVNPAAARVNASIKAFPLVLSGNAANGLPSAVLAADSPHAIPAFTRTTAWPARQIYRELILFFSFGKGFYSRSEKLDILQ